MTAKGRKILSKYWSVAKLNVTITQCKYVSKQGRSATKPSEGSLRLHGVPPWKQPVSYHLVPSEAGANAGWQYGNSVTTSASYNRREMRLREEQKMYVKERYFNEKVTVEFEPLEACLELDHIKKRMQAEGLDKAFMIEHFNKVQEKDPCAQRVKKILFTITVQGEAHPYEKEEEADYDLYWPTSKDKDGRYNHDDVTRATVRNRDYYVQNLKSTV